MNLLILRAGALGDVVLTFPLIKACQKYAGADNVVLAAPEHLQPIALMCGIERFTDIDSGGWHRLHEPSPLPSDRIPEALARAEIVLNLLGPADGPVHNNLAGLGKTIYSLAPPHKDLAEHASEYMAGILPGLGPISNITIPSRDLPPLAGELSDVGSSPAPLVIHPGTGSAAKLIDMSLWETFIAKYEEQLPIILITGPADEMLLSFCQSQKRTRGCRHYHCLPLEQVAALIGRAGMYCGLDSGISHVAALTGTPCAVIFHATNPRIWRPMGEHVMILAPEDLIGLKIS